MASVRLRGPQSPVPVAHMYGFGAEFLPAVMAGASIDLQEKTHLLKYLERERQFQPNIVFATPTLCEILMKGYKSPANELFSFRYIRAANR